MSDKSVEFRLEKTQKVPETKAQKFVRLAEARTAKAIKSIKMLDNLSNSSAYDFTKDQVDQIFKALNDQLKATRGKFGILKNKKFKL